MGNNGSLAAMRSRVMDIFRRIGRKRSDSDFEELPRNGGWKSRLNGSLVYLLSFLLPPAILFICYIIFQVWPFGDRSVLSLDLNAQYVYYFDYMYDVFAGDESIFYSWSRNLSGEFMGIIGYYLASPFNLLVWLFPREWITEGLLTMILAKAGAAGLSCSYFLRKHRGCGRMTTGCFSVMWALCGFFIVQTMNPMWLDGIVALPLVAAGIERICDKRKFILYVLSLVYIFVANFYIGYMVGIFSALYFFWYLVSGKSANKCFGQYCGSVIMYGAGSVCAILMSCFMILPVYKSLSNGKFAFTEPDYSLVENFDIAQIFIKLFPTEYDTVRMEGMPILYCGTLALVCAVMYFTCRRFTARERISSAVLIGMMALFMYIRPVDMMWHGGQMPNWLPYRYSFMISFLLIIFGAQTFDKLKKVQGRSFGTAFMILLAMLLYVDLNNESWKYEQVLTVAVPLVILAVVMILLWVYRKYGAKKPACIALAVFVCAEAGLNTAQSLYQMHDDIVFSTRESYRWDIPLTRKVTEQIHEMDTDFYRMEKTFHRCVNDPIALRMYGMSHSSSTLNAKVIEMLKSLGFAGREHYARYDGATMLTDDIFGVRYVFATDPTTVPYTETVPVETETAIKVFKNEDELGIAYLADSDIIGFDLNEYSPFQAQNKLATMISGNKGTTIFKAIDDVEFDSENIRIGSTTDAHYSYRKSNEDAAAWISYTVTAAADGPVYMYLPTNYERETQLYVNDIYRGNYFLYENHNIEYLGTYKKGEEFRVKLKLLDNAVYFTNAWFYYIDSASLERFNNTVQNMNASTELTRTGGCTLELSVDAAEDCALFTTIPAEEGWTVTIDGKPVNWETCLSESLICVPVSAGKHTIVLDFYPAGLSTGLMLTGFGLIGLAAMIVVSDLLKRADEKRKAETERAEEASENEDDTE